METKYVTTQEAFDGKLWLSGDLYYEDRKLHDIHKTHSMFILATARTREDASKNYYVLGVQTLKYRFEPADNAGKWWRKEGQPRPVVVCLCGSTRFSEAYQQANLHETLAGRIVLTIGCDMKSDSALFENKTPAELETIKRDLDKLHLSKIDLADEVLILNVGGYVGDSTRREIAYAKLNGKTLRWLEPDKALAL